MLSNYLSELYSKHLQEKYGEKSIDIVGMSSVDVNDFISKKIGISFSRNALDELVTRHYVTGPIEDNMQSSAEKNTGRRVRYGMQTIKDILVYRFAFGFFGSVRKGKTDFSKDWTIDQITNLVDDYVIAKSDILADGVLDLRDFYNNCGKKLVQIAKKEFDWIINLVREINDYDRRLKQFKVGSEEEYTEYQRCSDEKDRLEREIGGIQRGKWEEILYKKDAESDEEFQDRVKKVKIETISDFVCLGGLYFFFDQWFRHSTDDKVSEEAIYRNWRYLMEMLEVNYSCNFIVEHINDLMQNIIKIAKSKSESILGNNIINKDERNRIKDNQYDDKIEVGENQKSLAYLMRIDKILKNTSKSMNSLSLFYSEYSSPELSTRDRLHILQWLALVLAFSNGYELIEHEAMSAIRKYASFELFNDRGLFQVACHMYLVGNLHLIR